MTLLLLFRPHRYGVAPPPPVTSTALIGVRASLADVRLRSAAVTPTRTRTATLTPKTPPGGTIS